MYKVIKLFSASDAKKNKCNFRFNEHFSFFCFIFLNFLFFCGWYLCNCLNCIFLVFDKNKTIKQTMLKIQHSHFKNTYCLSKLLYYHKQQLYLKYLKHKNNKNFWLKLTHYKTFLKLFMHFQFKQQIKNICVWRNERLNWSSAGQQTDTPFKPEQAADYWPTDRTTAFSHHWH